MNAPSTSLSLTAAFALALSACTDSAPPASSAAETPLTDAFAVALALDPGGLRAVNTDTGASRLIAFDQPEGAVVAVVGRALGAEPTETGTNSECGAGPLRFASWNDGLTLWSQEGRFVGWAVNRAGPTTMGGIGVGSTRAQIEETVVAEFSHGSLGKQFRAGGLHGVMDDGRAAHIWAGVSCNFG